ncbi:glycosyltransferase family 2 protein [Periweissella cryptocerci]|uniref:Glycosyltransferase family 2 protein n=1 Tax=Periweissella cryptocerci TaxID=2506420 RepID=A0A4P6YWB5_9LACO|nr:glycosyltransferase family A protein [Periweissella cryptocerci]QBO37076.1 glycosyltransferase family 2 protein [Periweissella cryptocerci]
MMKITILTTTYNRAKLLDKLYGSLQKQTNKNFEWLIIDDGSSDNTGEIVRSFQKKGDSFEIIYYVKKNGGKHTALNFSHGHITGDVVIIMDSDDILLPNAIERISDEWERLESVNSYGTITFEQQDENNNYLGRFPQKKFDGSELDYRFRNGVTGDFVETIRADIFKKFIFPEYVGEKFFPEGWLWTQVFLSYRTVDFDEVLAVGGYQEDGLTNDGRKMRIKSPHAMMDYYDVMMNLKLPFKLRIKSGIAFNTYAHFLKRNEIVKTKHRIMRAITYVPGVLIAWHWTKYKSER